MSVLADAIRASVGASPFLRESSIAAAKRIDIEDDRWRLLTGDVAWIIDPGDGYLPVIARVVSETVPYAEEASETIGVLRYEVCFA